MAVKGRAAWATRYGFYFAAVGSAFGLGNLWRFPYIVGSSGGGAFVVLYLFTALFVGLPILTAELILGKTTRNGVVTSLSKMEVESEGERRWLKWLGYLAMAASLLLLSYYAVVSGWVLHFLIQFLVGIFREGSLAHAELFQKLMANGGLQVGLVSVHILLCILIVAKGVQQGIEKWIGYIMPVFGAVLVYLGYQSLNLSGAPDALRFLFYPDFSKITYETPIRAIGHVFFTLSLGFGAMITFGSYMKPESRAPGSALKVGFLDTVISLCVGLVIFPIIFTGGFRTDSGPTLLFETIPLLLNKVGLGDVFGFAFFLCAYLAALGASIGLLEVSVAQSIDSKVYSRRTASWRFGLLAFVVGIIPALSSSVFKQIEFGGMNLLELLDSAIIHWVLPVSVVGVSLTVGHLMKMKVKRNEFIFDEKESSYRIFANWIFMLRWGIPIIVTAALAFQVAGVLKHIVYFFKN